MSFLLSPSITALHAVSPTASVRATFLLLHSAFFVSTSRSFVTPALAVFPAVALQNLSNRSARYKGEYAGVENRLVANKVDDEHLTFPAPYYVT